MNLRLKGRSLLCQERNGAVGVEKKIIGCEQKKGKKELKKDKMGSMRKSDNSVEEKNSV